MPRTEDQNRTDLPVAAVSQAIEVQESSGDESTGIKTRLRIRHTKCGDIRWISHRDLARTWERLLRRAGLQLAFSQGFHPKPRISFPSALALGIEALDEIVEMEVLGAIDLPRIEHLLRREMPAGMELLELHALETSLGKAKVLGASYRIPHGLTSSNASPAGATGNSLDELQQRIDAILAAAEFEITREGKPVGCPTDHPYFGLTIEGDHFQFSLPTLPSGSIRPSELLEQVGLGHLLESGATLQRTAVHLVAPADTGDTQRNAPTIDHTDDRPSAHGNLS